MEADGRPDRPAGIGGIGPGAVLPPGSFVGVRVRRPEVLGDALAEAPTFEAEELLAQLDRIARDLSSDPARSVGHVRIHADQGRGPAALDLSEAWRGLCAAKAAGYRRQVRATRRDGWVALRYGALCFAVALAASLGLEHLEPMPRWLNRPLSEGFLIASWVSLWRPIELLLYEWLPFARMAATFEHLAGLPVTLAPGPGRLP